MAKASENIFPKVRMSTTVASAAPSGGEWRLESRANGIYAVSSNTGSAGTGPFSAGSAGSVATDAIWDVAGDTVVGTGANTAVRLAIGAAGGALSVINGAVAWNSGTAFPASKLTGDRYWRTDLGLECYWDGTRWLTTTLFTHDYMGWESNTVSGYSVRGAVHEVLYDQWLVNFFISAYVVTTNSGVSYWTLGLRSWDGATPSANIVALNTSAQANDVFVTQRVVIGALLGSTADQLEVQAVKAGATGTPGALVAAATLTYRLVVT